MMDYNERVRAHFFNPCHVVREFPESPDRVIETVGQAVDGEVFSVCLLVDDKEQVNLSFKAMANPYLIALLSILCDYASEKTVDELLQFPFKEQLNLLGLPKNKRYCLILVEDAIVSLVEKWRKQSEKNGN